MNKNFILMVLLSCIHLTTVQSLETFNVETLTHNQAIEIKARLTQQIVVTKSIQKLLPLNTTSIFLSTMLTCNYTRGFLFLGTTKLSHFVSSFALPALVKDYVLPTFLGATVAGSYYYYINNKATTRIKTAQDIVKKINKRFPGPPAAC